MKHIRLVLLLGTILGTASQAQAQQPPAGPTKTPLQNQRSTPPNVGKTTIAPTAPGATNAPGQPSTTVAPTTAAKSGAIIDPNQELTPLKVENMPLGQFIELYADMVNRTILRSSQLPTQQFITLSTRGDITKADALIAMETVMAMNGITIIPVGEKFIKVVPGAEAGTTGAAFSKADPDDLPISGRYVTQIVPLKYITTQDATAAITPFASLKTGVNIIPIQASQTLVLRDYSENIKRMMEIIEQVDKNVPQDFQPELIPIKYALASEIAQVLGSLTASGPGVSVGAGSRSGLTGRTGTTGTTGQGQQPGALGQPNTGTTGIGSAATGNRSSFGNRLSSIVNRASGGAGDFQILGEAKIIADERTNSLLIFANSQDMDTIKQIISQLDVVLAQVLIEAIIMEVSLDDSKNVGVSYQQQPKSLGNEINTSGGVINNNGFLNPSVGDLFKGATNLGPIISSGLPGGFSYFGTVGNTFDIALTASARDSRVNVLSRPRIQTSHAVPANLFVGQTVPYVTGTYFGGTTSGSSSQYQQKEVGITIDVLPLINPDGLVVMDIQQNIEQLGNPIRIDNNDVPTTTKRMATAKVAVRDRETVILGGFISNTKSTTKTGVPYLKDLPLLGALFRTKTDTGGRVELMVFLRPTVLPTPEAAAITATAERENLSGIRQAEFEVVEEERIRKERIEAQMRKQLGIQEEKARKAQKKNR